MDLRYDFERHFDVLIQESEEWSSRTLNVDAEKLWYTDGAKNDDGGDSRAFVEKSGRIISNKLLDYVTILKLSKCV